MKCPACDVDLLMTERKNIEIDYCPKCRGVWLDRGELDKLLDGSSQDQQNYTNYDNSSYDSGHGNSKHGGGKHGNGGYDNRNYQNNPNNQKKRRGSFLSDIFEGFGD